MGGGGEGGVETPCGGRGGWWWSCSEVELVPAHSEDQEGRGGLRRAAGGNVRERAEVFCPTRTRL